MGPNRVHFSTSLLDGRRAISCTPFPFLLLFLNPIFLFVGCFVCFVFFLTLSSVMQGVQMDVVSTVFSEE